MANGCDPGEFGYQGAKAETGRGNGTGMDGWIRIGVIGAGEATPAGYAAAREIGRLLARKGAVVVCGGLGGVMEAACRGAKEAGGLTVGILPGPDATAANSFVDLPISTNMGHARNVIIAHSAQALIAVEGSYGTLSEMAIALKLGRPVIALAGGGILPGALVAASPGEAVDLVFSCICSTREGQ